MHLPDPALPPLFQGHPVKAPVTAEDEACRRAGNGELSAGDLVWSRNTARADCALVLEPDVSLMRSCQMAALGSVALAETLGLLCPPQTLIQFRWPTALLINGAEAGFVRVCGPAGPPDQVPAWLVISISVALTPPSHAGEPGSRPDETCLIDEGAVDLTRTTVVEALAPRLLAWLHTWSEDGFRSIHDHWFSNAVGRDSDVTVEGTKGRVIGLDEDGNLLVKSSAGAVRAMAYLPHVRVWA